MDESLASLARTADSLRVMRDNLKRERGEHLTLIEGGTDD
jgi:hypothetical protein